MTRRQILDFHVWTETNRRAGHARPLNTTELNKHFPPRTPRLRPRVERTRERHALNDRGVCVTCSLLDRAVDLVRCTHGGPFAHCLSTVTPTPSTTTPAASGP